MMTNCSAIILAAGDGAKMKTTLPYVMLKVLSKPMISWVLSATKKSGIEKIAVVVSDRRNSVAEFAKGDCTIVEQKERRGTAHAVMQAVPFIEAHLNDDILILNGDSPLMDAGTIRMAHTVHKTAKNDATVICARIDNPFGYGRIIRDPYNGELQCIIEERDASSEIKRIREISAGAYWFKASALLDALRQIQPRQNGEYNLVDSIKHLIQNEKKVGTANAMSPDVVLGINDRAQFYSVNQLARRREIERHLEAGVSIPCTDGVCIDPEVLIGMDTLILPGTVLRGKVTIGNGCVIGPNTMLESTTVGDNVRLNNVQCSHAIIKNDAQVGPFVHIHPNSVIGEGVRVDSFTEIEPSDLEDAL